MQNIIVNDSFEFSITENDLNSFDMVSIAPKHYHILQNNSSFTAEVIAADFLNRRYTIRINNNLYEVAIDHPLKKLINSLGFSMNATEKITAIKSPMPGLIIDVSVKKGDRVKENDPLLVLEAMKMENSIISPREGVIKSIHMKSGDAVDKDELLIEFE